jgi:hypothetical protein
MLRFNIRDLLWLMVVLGLGFGWWQHVRDLRIKYEERCQAHTETIWEAVHSVGLTEEQIHHIFGLFNGMWSEKNLKYQKTRRWDAAFTQADLIQHSPKQEH